MGAGAVVALRMPAVDRAMTLVRIESAVQADPRVATVSGRGKVVDDQATLVLDVYPAGFDKAIQTTKAL
jgi:hypothetical protein